MPCFTLHNQWGSFHWSPAPRDQLHKLPTVLLVTFVLLLLLCVVGYFLSPVVPKKQQQHNDEEAFVLCPHTMSFFGGHIPLCLLDGRSWPVLPKIRVLSRSPGFQSEHWNGVAERRLTSSLFSVDCEVHTHSHGFLCPEPSDMMHYSAEN